MPDAQQQARDATCAQTHQRDAHAHIATVALWLGHESTDSTEAYLHSNNTIKQDAIEKIAPIDTPPGRYKPTDKLLAFLESL